jgi:AmmeMemoRadiSam system protein A
MLPLSEEDRHSLLSLARRAIVEAVVHSRVLEVPPPTGALGRPAGAFVTLHHLGRLRGCIGRVEAVEPLAHTVIRCAIGAALHDPRFAPVRSEELEALAIEISILTPPARIRPEEIEIGRHGLLISQKAFRGLLLPQVAIEHYLTPERFLEETCRKAGLLPGAWQDAETEIFGFTCEVFREFES